MAPCAQHGGHLVWPDNTATGYYVVLKQPLIVDQIPLGVEVYASPTRELR